MAGTFSGWTAEQYAGFRQDVPDEVVVGLVERFGLGERSCVVDLGSGTGQLAIPLAGRVGIVVAVEPEPDMLRLLRERVQSRAGVDVLTVLGSDRDLPLVRALAGDRVDLVTVANALHFMDPAAVFADAASVLRPGGGLAVISHGWPLWLGDSAWAVEVRAFLEGWLGSRVESTCGMDEETMRERERMLSAAGFDDVAVARYEFTVERSPEYIVGNLYSALSETQVPADRRAEFEAGILDAVARGAGAGAGDGGRLVERVPVLTLTGRTPPHSG